MTTPNPENICVFAGAYSPNSEYTEVAYRMGELIGENGFNLVYGGIGAGLMASAAQGARSKGAEVIGVIPGLKDDPYLSEEKSFKLINRGRIITTPSLEARKLRMIGLSRAVVALPGGTGTFDEIATTLRAGRGYSKKFVLLNAQGYYDGLRLQLDRMSIDEFSLSVRQDFPTFADTPEAAMDHILAPPPVAALSRFLWGRKPPTSKP